MVYVGGRDVPGCAYDLVVFARRELGYVELDVLNAINGGRGCNL